MTRFEFKLPDIGEGVAEGEIVSWLAQVGEDVEENQELVEVMTDKATVTIASPKAGRLLEARGQPGQRVPVGSVLVVLELRDAADAGAPAPVAAPLAPAPAVVTPPVSDGSGGPVGNLDEVLPGMASARDDRGGAAQGEGVAGQPLAAPATRRRARELGVDLRQVPPTGKAGRVTPEDVERFAASQRGGSGVTGLERPEPTPPPVARVAASADPESEERIPIRGVRRRIFENMARSKHTAAHFHYVEECDVGALVKLRDRVKPLADAQGVKLTFLPFILKAVVTALQAHPALNGWVDDQTQEIVRRRQYDLGIAVATDAGLIVPVIRRADRRSILDLAREVERLAEAARAGRTQPADLGGSTFTVTSLGKLGGFVAPPIINYPELGIMGVHAIKRRPVVRGDTVTVGEVMMLSWSFDHRIIDGHVAAAFAQDIVALLEQPDRLLVSMP